jgi:hypothetical protein
MQAPAPPIVSSHPLARAAALVPPRFLVVGLAAWLLAALVATAMGGLTYVAVQQALRQGANDPQVQMAEDAAVALAGGAAPAAVVPPTRIDPSRSLAPYLIVFDDAGQPVASSDVLAGGTPSPPAGVFDYTRTHLEDRFTWQPAPGVRDAVVVVRYSGASSGFVMAGRSLREVEARESQLSAMVGLTWLAALGASLLLVAAGVAAFTVAARR